MARLDRRTSRKNVSVVQERQGPKDIVLKTLSAIAAAQLAVLPFSGQSTFYSMPSLTLWTLSDPFCIWHAGWLSNTHACTGPAIALPDLKAQAEESDRKTDNLPTFKDIGSSLNNKFGQTDPKDVGKAVEQNTPGEHFLQESILEAVSH